MSAKCSFTVLCAFLLVSVSGSYAEDNPSAGKSLQSDRNVVEVLNDEDYLDYLNASGPQRAIGQAAVVSEIEYELIGTALWTHMSHVAVAEPYAIVAVPYGILIFDISDKGNPAFISRLPVTGAYDIALDGDLAYVACGHDQAAHLIMCGLAIVDISDPYNPYLRSRYQTEDRVRGVAISGQYAFLACWFSGGLIILDVSDPDAPVLVGQYDTAGDAQDVAVQGDYAYVADYFSLAVFDVSDVANPVQIGGYPAGDILSRVQVKGSSAYLADEYGGLLILDIFDPAHVGFDSRVSGSSDPVEDIVLVGDTVYATHHFIDLSGIDVTNPDYPVETGDFNSTMPYPTHKGVAVEGNYAFLADSNMLRIIDVSDHANMNEVGDYNVYGPPLKVAVSGDYAYVTNRSGLEILDISGSGDPDEVGFIGTVDKALDVTVDDTLAYVCDGFTGLHIINVADPAHPVEIGSYDTPGFARSTALRDGYAFIADDDSLFILDVSDPTTPVRAGAMWTAGKPHQVVLQGNYAYIADWDAQLTVADISDVHNPAYAGTLLIYDNSWSNRLAVRDHYLYLLVISYYIIQDMVILDIANPLSPHVLGVVRMPSAPNDIILDGNYALFATYWQGLWAVNISNPRAPVLAGGYQTPGQSYGLDVANGRAYIADIHGFVSVDYTRGFTCGDANSDDQQNISDATYIINWIFKGGPAPQILAAADADCNLQSNISDAVRIVNWIFKGGAPPCCP